MRLFAVLMCVVLPVYGQGDDVRVLSQSASGVVLAVKVPEQAFKDEFLEDLAARLMNEYQHQIFLIANISIRGAVVVPYITHRPFSYYQESAKFSRESIVNALLIAIRGNSVLLISRPKSPVRRLVVRGSDPTTLSSGKCSGELLYIGHNLQRVVTSFVELERAEGASECHRLLVELLRGGDSMVSVMRPDPWFFGWGMKFPVVYPFSRRDIPGYEDWAAVPTVECRGTGEATRCTLMPPMFQRP